MTCGSAHQLRRNQPQRLISAVWLGALLTADLSVADGLKAAALAQPPAVFKTTVSATTIIGWRRPLGARSARAIYL